MPLTSRQILEIISVSGVCTFVPSLIILILVRSALYKSTGILVVILVAWGIVRHLSGVISSLSYLGAALGIMFGVGIVFFAKHSTYRSHSS